MIGGLVDVQKLCHGGIQVEILSLDEITKGGNEDGEVVQGLSPERLHH